MTPLSEAISIAVKAHDGQVDKAGQPYILHCLRVMLAMSTDEDRIVAVLHDVVEDTDLTLDDLRGFGPEAVEALDALTRRKRELYLAYIERLSANPQAVRVKMIDLDDNSDLGRLRIVTAEDFRRVERYREAQGRLMLLALEGSEETRNEA